MRVPKNAEVRIPSEGTVLAGTLLMPAGEGPFPCVVIAGGTMSHTRDGRLIDPERVVPERDALKRLATRLAAAGYASIRWDKRGFGGTPPGPRPATYRDETADLIAVMHFARRHPAVSRVAVAGESAGGYVACLAAKRGVPADAYIFLGALCSPIEDLFAYNYGRLVAYAAQSEENHRWAQETSPFGLALGRHYKAMIEAALRGDETYVLRYGDRVRTVPLDRWREELAEPPHEQFRYIAGPVLILHGERDMNVPVEHAARIEKTVRAAGNSFVTRIVIPHADHSFQVAAADEDMRMRERHSCESFNRRYHEDLYTALAAWLRKVTPTGAKSSHAPHPIIHKPRPGSMAWDGIRVVGDVTDARQNPGVTTLEGRIGPLLKGEGCQAHYIEMPPGLYCAEHPHATESLIYTVRGRWVLASGGVRKLMRPGSLFWFGAGVPTGYEVPFDEPAFILIFKGQRSEESDEAFFEYLRRLAGRLEEERAGGQPFTFDELPPEHPARIFGDRRLSAKG
ncbi:alpha/beta fold hydrolase [Desulforudis sp. DRI-14]|uniref:alpha/beta fold hydrolase n=1 Tax=Desulforudis sp. DRI-14 TaxID=3459793 RepID=UPI004041A0A4